MEDKNVEEVMVRNVRTISPEQSIADVRDIFEKEGFRHLPVEEYGSLVGMISRTDLMRITYGAEMAFGGADKVNELIYESTTVGTIMSTDLKTVESGVALSEAARIMLKYQLSAVPVVKSGE
ncbi:MAG: CBS domain-containing protein, partial [Flavobacteriales bacterium]|nr:CBS domain-containing protein [Flavobacteriales bacterium]